MSGRIVCGFGFIVSSARGDGFGSFDRAEQDFVCVQHDGARLWRIGRSGRDVVFGAEADEVVAHELVDAHAVQIVNPERAQAGREIIYEVAKRAHPL